MFNVRTHLSILKGVVTKRSPFYVQFFITNRCFLNCKMCNIISANTGLDLVNLDQVEKIAKNLRKIGAGVVLLTGGEPFLRDDIVEIAKVLKKYGLTPRLQTAGLISKFDKMLECNRLGARDINVSLDTLDEELGDYINGVKGSWRRAIQTIGKISREFTGQDTTCALGCVLSPYNIDDVEGVLDFANKIGWSLSLVPVHINSFGQNLHFRGYNESFIFKREDYPRIENLIERLRIRKKKGDNLFDSEKYLNSIVTFIETKHPSWRKNNICDSPDLYFAIRPNGRFAPCCDQDIAEPIYVYDENFPNLYKWGNLRRKVHAVTKTCPGCNFGSYPEMTLIARHISTFLERIRLELRGSRLPLRPFSDDELFEMIRAIRREHKHI